MFSWLTFPWNNTAERNSLLTNPRSGSLFPGCFLSICLLFSLTAYLFSQLYQPICQLVRVELSFPISSVSGVSSLIIGLHRAFCGSGFPSSSSQPVRADCSHASGNGEEGSSAWCSGLVPLLCRSPMLQPWAGGTLLQTGFSSRGRRKGQETWCFMVTKVKGNYL